MCYFSLVTAIGIRELRQHASRYVAMAKSGERVAVTERGKLVAYLIPAAESGSTLDRLEATGQYHPAVERLTDLDPPPPLPSGTRPLSEALSELRDDERW